MRVKGVRTEQCGPLNNIVWEPDVAEVIYDSNEEGKTALVDALVYSMFGTREFPGADRFGVDLQVEVTVERAEEEKIFPSSAQPRNLIDWLEWPEKQLARLFCVRAGELELASNRQAFSHLIDGLADLLSGVGGKLDRVKQKVRDAAHLTGTEDWTDREGHRVKREVVNNLQKLRQLGGALPHALKLEGKERERREKENLKKQTDNELRGVRQALQDIEHQETVRLYHEGRKLYREQKELRQRIEQDYARYRDEDALAWEQAENQLTMAKKLGSNVKDIVELDSKIREEKNKLSHLESQWQEAERRIQQERANLRSRVHELQSQVADHENIRRTMENREAVQKMLPWGCGASVLLGTALLAAGLLKDSVLGFVLGGIFVTLAVVGFILFIKWQSDKRQFITRCDDLRRAWRNEGITIAAGESLQDSLSRWEQTREQELAKKSEDARAPQAEAERHLNWLKGMRQAKESSAEGYLENLRGLRCELSLQFTDSGACLRQARAFISELENAIGELRNRSGMPTREDLEGKVNERRTHQRQQEMKVSLLFGKLGVKSIEAARLKLDSLKTNLREGEENEDILATVPTMEELGKKRRENQQRASELKSTLDNIDKVLSMSDVEIDNLRRPLFAIDVHTAADVYAAVEMTRQMLRQRVAERLAGTWTLRALETIQGSYQELLDSSLREGESTASEIFHAITGRYHDIRLDPERQTFIAVQEDGTEYPEDKLSDGACKQLLFALRVSFLQRVLEGETAFLILDDPFITFDDEGRKEKAIQWLAKMLDAGWQVLYFTADVTTRDLFATHLHASSHRIADLVGSAH